MPWRCSVCDMMFEEPVSLLLPRCPHCGSTIFIEASMEEFDEWNEEMDAEEAEEG